MTELYPLVEPHDEGMLGVGDGNLVHWEVSGNPDGTPALGVHGGPGSGAAPGMRRGFDPDRYRIVLFDQRGCGASAPHASDPARDMSVNTTAHLVSDMELLRRHLGVERWVLLGWSWGSTLALAYAQAHPERVRAVVLSAVTMTRRTETDWLYRGVARFLPQKWRAFRAAHTDDDLLGGEHLSVRQPARQRVVGGQGEDGHDQVEQHDRRAGVCCVPGCGAEACADHDQ